MTTVPSDVAFTEESHVQGIWKATNVTDNVTALLEKVYEKKRTSAEEFWQLEMNMENKTEITLSWGIQPCVPSSIIVTHVIFFPGSMFWSCRLEFTICRA